VMLCPSRLRPYLHLSRWHAPLPHRSVLALQGSDARKLLQGLVTCDVTALEAAPLYAGFLSAQGRVLFDGFLIGGIGGSVIIDVEHSTVEGLVKHLKRYKLRLKTTIQDLSKEYQVMVAVDNSIDSVDAPAQATSACEGGAWRDPRLPACLGHRILRRFDAPLPQLLEGSGEATAELHAFQLKVLGIPSSAQELMPSEALPLEANLELLNAISFRKGCYLGQELTARTKFRGVVRKRLVPMIDAKLAPDNATPASALSIPALGSLPSHERALAAQLLCDERQRCRLSSSTASEMGSMGTAAVIEEPPTLEAGTALLDRSGGKKATVRSYDPVLGLGLALCRLDTLGEHEPLVPKSGPPILPLRPSWWPVDIATDQS